MVNSEEEIWRAHPEYTGTEVSTFGRVRTLDRVVPCGENGTRFVKGRILKQCENVNGYLQVGIPIDGKWSMKRVNRLIAQTFIQNPKNLPQVNHRDCDRKNNNVDNLEWCTASYNRRYQEKFGISSTEARGHPLFAINLDTLEVLHFRSRVEAGRKLGISDGNINSVIKGSRKTAGGFWFKEDDGDGIEIDNDKLNDIAAGMNFTGGIFAVNLKTLEVSRFNSQSEASRVLGISVGNINSVIKGRHRYTKGYWFVNDDGHAVDVVKSKLHDIGGTGLKIYN